MEQDIKNAHTFHLGIKMKFNEVMNDFLKGKIISKGRFTFKLEPLDNGQKDDIIIIKCHKKDGTVEIFYNDFSDAFISATDLMSEDWNIDEVS